MKRPCCPRLLRSLCFLLSTLEIAIPRPTDPILAVAVYTGHGPMSDGCALTIMTRRESAAGPVLLREKA